MTSKQSSRPCPSAGSTFRDHAHPTDRAHVAADARCVGSTSRKSCDSRSCSPSESDHPRIQPPRRTLGTVQGWRRKKNKTPKNSIAKQWKDFNRQAARRGKPVTLMVFEHARLVVQPCFYCGAGEKISVDRARKNESYTRENPVPCCGPCNMAKQNSRIRAFVQRARAIEKTTRAFAELKRNSPIYKGK